MTKTINKLVQEFCNSEIVGFVIYLQPTRVENVWMPVLSSSVDKDKTIEILSTIVEALKENGLIPTITVQ